MAEKEEFISILSYEGEENTRNAFPTVKEMTSKINTISCDVLKDNLSDVIGKLEDVVADMPLSDSNYSVDTIKFSLCVDGAGKFSIIGGVSAGFSSTITITLKHR